MAREVNVASYVGPTLSDIQKALSDLDDRIKMLSERLSDVLAAPRVATGPSEAPMQEKDRGDSTLAVEAVAILNTVHVRIRSVEDLIERIEI
jgi:hypothetical protein